MIDILVVEDDIKLNQILCRTLSNNGYNSVGCLNPQEAYDTLYDTEYDLIISDIMMPGIDGFEFAKTIRSSNENIPIIFMSARDDFVAKQTGFKLGIDDYLVKPVNLDELLLRVEALLRRANISAQKKISIGNFVIDAESMSVILGDEDISLTIREFNILFKMLSYPNKAFSRQQLINEFWEAEGNTTNRAVDVYITKLRDKLALCDDFKIVTVHGLGYKVVISK